MITGSTRMKAGTTTKVVLNTITTAAMVGYCKVDGNHRETVRQIDRGLHDACPGQVPEALVRVPEPPHGARHARREVTQHRPVGTVAVGVQTHVPRGRKPRLLAVVLRKDGAVGEPDHHEVPTAQVPRLRVHDGEGEPRGDGRIDRVAAGREDVEADPRGVLVRGGDETLGGRDRSGVRPERPLRRERAARLQVGAVRGAG